MILPVSRIPSSKHYSVELNSRYGSAVHPEYRRPLEEGIRDGSRNFVFLGKILEEEQSQKKNGMCQWMWLSYRKSQINLTIKKKYKEKNM